MVIVTSGARYIDIDAYACSIAYAELLSASGQTAAAISTAPWNESITPLLRSLPVPFHTTYRAAKDDQFIVTDVSDPSQFDAIVDEARIVEVIDHYTGFEDYWGRTLGGRCRIEFIGAAATLVYEQWQALGKLDEMSPASAQLLAAAILDNTLNFRAGVTTERDRAAYDWLARHAQLDTAWAASYLTDCQAAILADLSTALRNDTKVVRFTGLPENLCIGQLVVWDAKPILNTQLPVVVQTLSAAGPYWLANVVNISEGRSCFIAGDDAVRRWAHGVVGADFNGMTAVADRLWLRKEIIKQGQTSSRS